MESKKDYPKNENAENNKSISEDEEVVFENSSVDPGFGDENELESSEDERDGDIDSNKNISEMQSGKEDEENDALNYKNDRENGAYNPKNI